MKFDFAQKTVVVTGGAQGIGLEISRQFLNSGATVVIWDYSADSLNSCKGELASFGDKVLTHRVDVTDRMSLVMAISALPDEVDVLINNAGITRDKSFAKLMPEDWDAVISTNLTGLYNVTKVLLEKFRGYSDKSSTASKRIINISSVVGIYGNFGQANYAAAKAGVIGMTKTLGKELGRKGFTVNAIAPGFIATAMTKAMPAEALQAMTQKIPVPRLGDPKDIAFACLFLASDAAGYINGATLSVDGGLSL